MVGIIGPPRYTGGISALVTYEVCKILGSGVPSNNSPGRVLALPKPQRQDLILQRPK